MGSLVLTDHGGNTLGRFGAAAIRRALRDPVKPTDACKHLEYAMVWCEASQTFLMRLGHGRQYTLTLIYWESKEQSPPIEETFEPSDFEAAVKKFIELCKRKPLYETT